MPGIGTLLRLLAALMVLAPAAAAQDPQLVRMGTGSVTGLYYPVGVSLCRLVNQHRRETNLHCSAIPSGGSVSNIAGLRDDTFDFAIVQSDSQAAAAEGAGAFEAAGPYPDLRSVMALYPELLTVVARADAGVTRIEDLAGKNVALGAEGSGTRAVADAVLGALGWTPASFADTPDVAADRLARTLCDGGIDAFFYTVGSPALVIQEATTSCDAKLVPVSGAAVDALVASEPYYVAATIPAGLYRGNPEPVATFGVGATLVTRADEPVDTVYTVVRAIFRDIDMLRGLDPVLSDLDPAAMTEQGLSVPLHPGAARFYQESGLVN